MNLPVKASKSLLLFIPAHVVDFWVSVEVVAVLADSIQLGKDAWRVHAPTPQVNIAPLVVNTEAIVQAILSEFIHEQIKEVD